MVILHRTVIIIFVAGFMLSYFEILFWAVVNVFSFSEDGRHFVFVGPFP